MFPPEITLSNLRPDIVAWSQSAKRAILIELTVPWETHIEDAHERKLTRYEELRSSCIANGWQTHLFAIEVGCRGFVSKSVPFFCRQLGFASRETTQLIKHLEQETEKASGWIWLQYVSEHPPG